MLTGIFNWLYSSAAQAPAKHSAPSPAPTEGRVRARETQRPRTHQEWTEEEKTIVAVAMVHGDESPEPHHVLKCSRRELIAVELTKCFGRTITAAAVAGIVTRMSSRGASRNNKEIWRRVQSWDTDGSEVQSRLDWIAKGTRLYIDGTLPAADRKVEFACQDGASTLAMPGAWPGSF